MSSDRSGPDHDAETHVLSEFAETFGRSAQQIIHSTGWVVYVVGTELGIKHFLASDADAAEMADYERHYARLDPLAPVNCIPDGRLVACLNEALVPLSPGHRQYMSAMVSCRDSLPGRSGRPRGYGVSVSLPCPGSCLAVC